MGPDHCDLLGLMEVSLPRHIPLKIALLSRDSGELKGTKDRLRFQPLAHLPHFSLVLTYFI
jgi:hypothetical protein